MLDAVLSDAGHVIYCPEQHSTTCTSNYRLHNDLIGNKNLFCRRATVKPRGGRRAGRRASGTMYGVVEPLAADQSEDRVRPQHANASLQPFTRPLELPVGPPSPSIRATVSSVELESGRFKNQIPCTQQLVKKTKWKLSRGRTPTVRPRETPSRAQIGSRKPLTLRSRSDQGLLLIR